MAKQEKRERPTWEHVDEHTREAGWFRPYLIEIDALLWRRWAWWLDRLEAGTLGEPQDHPIPQVPFAMSGVPGERPYERLLMERCPDSAIVGMLRENLGTRDEARAHVERVFGKAMFQYFARASDLLEWWLWGFGSPRATKRPAIPEGAAITMYHELEMHRLVANPSDWGALIYRLENKKGAAWFPTPLSITNCMVQMTFSDADRDGVDSRLMSVCDPCAGTGVMLLAASNYSVRLSGVDIDWSMVVATEWAAWLFMPWMIANGEGRIREIDAAEAAERVSPILPPRVDAPAHVPAPMRTGARQPTLFDLEPT